MKTPRPDTARASIRRARRRGVRRLVARVAARLGRTVFGVLPHARRIVAANDPQA